LVYQPGVSTLGWAWLASFVLTLAGYANYTVGYALVTPPRYTGFSANKLRN